MMKRRTVEQSIQMSITEGYVEVAKGTGTCDESIVNDYRAKGYDVRWWYLNRSKENKSWVLYVKEKKARGRAPKKSPAVDYSKLSVKELYSICKDRKIPGYSKLNKQKLIEVLNNAG